jgi:hypothetical protein
VEQDFWVPQSGGIGMGVSILSYDGRIQFGVITDAGLVPDPDRIVGRFGDEFDKLMWLTLMSPWTTPDVVPEEHAAARLKPGPGIQSPKKARKKAVAISAADPPGPIPKRFRNL